MRSAAVAREVETTDGASGPLLAVALTAHPRVEDRTRALEAGYHVHVPRPVEPTELVSVIATLVAPAG